MIQILILKKERVNKMLDLCKMFGVEEGEKFKFYEYGDIYFIQNGYLYFIDIDSIEKKSYLNINNVVGKNIIKLPKKKQFTDDELCILRNIDKEYKWIAKDRDGDLWIYTNKPKKEYDRYWKDCSSSKSLSFEPLDIFKNSLFTEIEWEDEEPICIDDYVDRENEED